jgi:hypothetical protein
MSYVHKFGENTSWTVEEVAFTRFHMCDRLGNQSTNHLINQSTTQSINQLTSCLQYTSFKLNFVCWLLKNLLYFNIWICWNLTLFCRLWDSCQIMGYSYQKFITYFDIYNLAYLLPCPNFSRSCQGNSPHVI